MTQQPKQPKEEINWEIIEILKSEGLGLMTGELEKHLDDPIVRKLKSFIYENSEDQKFKRCWALENLQPLEISKNRRKHNCFQEI